MQLELAAVYARVSTDDQEELGTIQDQINYAQKFVEERNIAVFDWYIDDGVSGTIPMEQRPEGGRLLRDAAAHRFQVVYCYNMTRWARDTYVYLAAEKFLKDRSIRLRFMRENIDLSTPAGRIQGTIFAGFSQYERDLIVERTTTGKIRVASEGHWSVGRTPYGYQSVQDGKRKVLAINEPEAEIVRRIYHLLLDEGMSLTGIAKYFNQLGIPAPDKARGEAAPGTGLWSRGSCRKMIANPVYKGEYHFRRKKAVRGDDGKYRYEDRDESEHIIIPTPAIVTPERWEQALQQSYENRKKPKGKSNRQYLLTGVLVCGKCGAPFGGSGGVTRGRHYYRCGNSVSPRIGATERCDMRSVRAERIEEVVWKDVEYWLSNPRKMQTLIEMKIQEYSEQLKPTESELGELERAIAQKQAARKKLRELYVSGIISIEELQEDLASLAEQVEELHYRREQLHLMRMHIENGQSILVTAGMVMAKLRMKMDHADFAIKREVLRTIVAKVVVQPETIHILYYFSPQNGELDHGADEEESPGTPGDETQYNVASAST
ncbi:MAG: recombinase family protein [Anaerolineae bacterium]